MGTSENFLGFLETCTIRLLSHFRLHQDQGIIISNKQTSQVSQLQTSLGSLAIWSPVCSGFIKLQADAEWLYKQKDWIHCTIWAKMNEILYLRIKVYRCYLVGSNVFLFLKSRTIDPQRGNSLHCTAKNSIQIPYFLGSIFCLPHRPNFSDIFDTFIGCL